jgi:hypothetical protein
MTRLFIALLLGAAVSTTAPAAALATPIQPSVDTVQQRLSLRTLMSCVAKSRPNWARQLLAQPYLGEEQTRTAGEALSGKDRCIMKEETEMTFRTSSMVSSLAEYFLRAELANADLDRVSRALNTLTPLNSSEDFALCVAARDPIAARDLALSEPGGNEELQAADKLALQVQPCVIKGEQPTVDLQSLRGLMSMALYRAMLSGAVAQN